MRKVYKFERLIFFEISTFAGLFSQYHGLPQMFFLYNARWKSDAFNKLKKKFVLNMLFMLGPLEYLSINKKKKYGKIKYH